MSISGSSVAPALPEFDRLWDYGNPGGTETRFLELLPQAEQSGDRSYYGALLTQIARAQGLQRKFEHAHGTLDQAEKVIAGEPDGIATVRLLLERGRVFNSSGDRSSARPLFERAYELASRLGLENLAIDAAHMIAIVEDPDEALRWNELALELAENAADPKAKGWQGTLYNNIGWTYMDRGEPERALELFQRNVAWHMERKTGRGLFIANWCAARALRELGAIDEALQMQRLLLEQMMSEGIEPDGFVYEELGECLLLKGEHEEAGPMFANAYELLSVNPMFAHNEAGRLARLKTLGSVA